MVKVSQSCPTLCEPMDYTVHGILQARILEWVAFHFSRGSSQPRDRTQVSGIAGRWTEPGKLQFTGSQTVGHKFVHDTYYKYIYNIYQSPGKCFFRQQYTVISEHSSYHLKCLLATASFKF